MNSSIPSYQSIDCVVKWGIRFINSFRKFFHLSQNVYHTTEKKTAEVRLKRISRVISKTDSASASS